MLIYQGVASPNFGIESLGLSTVSLPCNLGSELVEGRSESLEVQEFF